MNNLEFPPSFQRKDNGERTIHWIPIESRMPTSGIPILATVTKDTNKWVDMVWYDKFENTFRFYVDNCVANVIAWAHLPIGYNQLKG